MTLKIKFADFEIITRSRSAATPISDRSNLDTIAVALLAAEMPMRKRVRLLGVSLSSLTGKVSIPPQLSLLDAY